MGYFEQVTDQHCRIDDLGRTVFYPWKDLGAGYLLPDEAAQKEVTRFLTTYAVVNIVVIVLAALAIGGMPGLLVGQLLALLWYVISSRSLVRRLGMEVAKERLGFRAYWANEAARMSFPALFFCLLFFVLAACGAQWLMSRGDRLLGVVGIVIFGAMANISGYMITIKTRNI